MKKVSVFIYSAFVTVWKLILKVLVKRKNIKIEKRAAFFFLIKAGRL